MFDFPTIIVWFLNYKTTEKKYARTKSTGNIHSSKREPFKLSSRRLVFRCWEKLHSFFITCVRVQFKVSIQFVKRSRIELKVPLLRHTMILNFDDAIRFKFFTSCQLLIHFLIGLPKGTSLITKKSVECKAIIQKHSKDFGGTLEDPDVLKLCGCSRNSYYKYKRELKTTF